MRMNWADAAKAMAGDPEAAAVEQTLVVTGVATDTRRVRPGDVFFCLRGSRVDGHDFAAEALSAGAAAIVAERILEIPEAFRAAPVLYVDDTLKALGKLANAWRRRFTGKVVGITGTAGKTTLKELLACVLSLKGRTAKNFMNLNNQIGLPLSVLATDGDEAFWVMEAGISKPHDMDELGMILEPDVAVILNAGTGHAEGLGSCVAHYKARLLAYVVPEGLGIISADYPELVKEAEMVIPTPEQLERFTARSREHKETNYSATYLGVSGQKDGTGRFALNIRGRQAEVIAPFNGSYGAENLAAVCAVADRLGLEIEDITRGIEASTLPDQRFAISRAGSWLLVDDSYNANPLSMKRMIESAAELAAAQTANNASFVCVLGEMFELGHLADEEHETLGSLVARAAASALFWKGGHAEAVRRGLEKAGFTGVFAPITGKEDIMDVFEKSAMGAGVVLFKGSRGNRLEECVNIFRMTAESKHAV